MLKLLAIQVQKECKEYVMRCLEPEMMYYLCNDYEISQSDNGMWQVSKRKNDSAALMEVSRGMKRYGLNYEER